jgi:glycosyltransferase involved in cell wall biosynthesis
LDADDEWYPNKLAEQLRVAYDTEFHNLGVVYCRYTIIDDNGDLTDEHYIYEPEVTARGNVYSLLLETNKIAASDSGVLVRRDCFEKVGGFDETLSAYEDWDMWLRLAEQYEFDLSNAALVKIRRHAKSIQHRMSHMLDNQLRFYQKWLVRLPSDAACYSRWRLDIAYRVIAAWKDRASLGLVKKILSQENRRTLFSPTFGSFFLYLLGAMPLIAIRFLIKRTNHPIKVLRRKEGRVISSEGKGTDHV